MYNPNSVNDEWPQEGLIDKATNVSGESLDRNFPLIYTSQLNDVNNRNPSLISPAKTVHSTVLLSTPRVIQQMNLFLLEEGLPKTFSNKLNPSGNR